jgi:hypothetical protein
MRITARQARIRAEKPYNEAPDIEIDVICEQINNFACAGHRSLECSNLSGKVIEWLASRGYGVFVNTGMTEKTYLISWEYAE